VREIPPASLTHERFTNGSPIRRYIRFMRSVVALVVACAALLVCASLAPAGTASGIRGTVIKGPTKPVCEEGVPCTAPASGVVIVATRNRTVVGRATTTRNGTFRIVLPAGSYVIRTEKRFPIGGMRPRTVAVMNGRFTVVRLAIDTGIR
jgi:hypothetical protein